jgi:terminase small subunit / prophage DNA-packing protein
MAEEAGLISGAVAARLLTLTPEEFRKLDRAGWFERAGKDSFRIVDVVQGHIRWLKKQADQTGCTVAQAANHIGVTQRRFFELLDKGVINRAGKEGYTLSEVRAQYIRHLREIAAGRGDGYIDLPVERALLARQQTESAALRNAIMRSEYVLVEEVHRQVENEHATIRERLVSIPGKMASPLAHQPREEIEARLRDEVSEILHEFHEPAEIARRAAGFDVPFGSGEEGVQTSSAPQPDPVG